MSAELKVLATRTDELQGSVKELLTEALEENFVTIVIVGTKQDGTAWCKRSQGDDTMRFLGAIEWMKAHVLAEWK